MRVGDIVVHPKYGKGDVVKIMTEKDQVICFLANENRYFTKAGAEFMVQAADNSKASMGADFDHTAKTITKGKVITSSEAKMIHQCEFCSREFKNYQGLRHHQWQCPKNPDRKTWERGYGKVKKKPGAQPGNQHARRYKPTEKVPISYAERKGLIDDPVKIYSSSKDQTSLHKMPEQQDIDTETVSNTGATPQAPTPPTDGRWSTPIYGGFATNKLYDYLLSGILIAILICGIIYAALGVKLLLTN